MPSMKKVKLIASPILELNTFIRNVNDDIVELNKLIDSYNRSRDKDRISKLTEVLKYKQYIENKYSDNDIRKCAEFSSEIQEKLFLAIKAEFASNGISSLYGIGSSGVPPKSNTFSELLANMAPDKVTKLTKILSYGAYYDPHELRQLYAPDGDPAFDNFLNHNEISFLGGGNSKNFRIKPDDGSPPYVLKIENRLGMPKLPVAHLQKDALKDRLTTVMAERQTTLVSGSETITRTILTTEFCSGGNLIAHSKDNGTDTQKRTEGAISLYGQMLDTLIDIGKAGCAFSDMKNSNWLVDIDGQLVIADTKAFIFCEPGGMVDYTKVKASSGGAFIQTPYVNPPEFHSRLAKGIPISADNMHAFMYGKNLYQYLTECSDDYLYGRNDATLFNFDKPIFKTKDGQVLQQVIQDMVKTNPDSRISLAEAKDRLAPLRSVRLEEDKSAQKRTNISILEQISSHGFGAKDAKMREFVEQQKMKINNSTDLRELANIQKSLTTILKEQKSADYVKEVIEKYRRQAGLFSVGMNAKANKIEIAICDIPIENRGKIKDVNYDLGRKVHEAVATHRHFSFFRSLKYKGGGHEIDEHSAAKTYKTFKEKLDEVKTEDTKDVHTDRVRRGF